MTTTPLHDLVAQKVNTQWSDFAREHPHLAAVIDRTQLIEATVDDLRDDRQYQDAMRAADLDEARLLHAASALDRLEQLLHLALPR